MTTPSLLTIVLGAGKGTRMKSAVPKVLHRVAGLSMLGHVLKLAGTASAQRTAVVIGPGMDAVAAEARVHVPAAEICIQAEQLGTAHAVRMARAAIAAHDGDVLVAFADTPLFRPETVAAVRAALQGQTRIAVVGFEAADPTGYGRLLRNDRGQLFAIREHKDATEAERQTRLCNAGLMGFQGAYLLKLLDAVGNANANGEFYLTDVVELAFQRQLNAAVVLCPESEVLGVNSRDQLAAAEAIWQGRRRREAMLNGATLIAPETVWFAHDTVIGQDVLIEPNVFFGPGVVIEDGVTIKANTHIQGIDGKSREGIVIRKGAEVGPFARLRPGADIGPDVHIGNFVEVKNARMEAGSKANHLAYIGDGRVGEKANIGAGTIFCNYDGYFKHHTDVGRGAFVGSNTSLVAPVKIGDGAYVGSGSVITKNVAADALALERATQETREGWAAKFRATMQRRKAEKAKL
ncbi:MAG: bifunctional UDP-N-acetylglucosamine diphosphorylase/glucosamine-1-phosphate N-acetyltransferase GlmU [Hyphomicrobiaceae bacterium]